MLDETIHLLEGGEFRRDPQNLNRGTDVGRGFVKRSLTDNAFGRPMLATNDGTLIAGNHTWEQIEQLKKEGVEFGEPIVIETDGTRPIIHKRTDIPHAGDLKAVRLKIADNQTNKHNYDPDLERTRQVVVTMGIEPMAVGLTPLEMQVVEATEPGEPGDGNERVGSSFQLMVTAEDEQDQRRIYEKLIGMGLEVRLLSL